MDAELTDLLTQLNDLDETPDGDILSDDAWEIHYRLSDIAYRKGEIHQEKQQIRASFLCDLTGEIVEEIDLTPARTIVARFREVETTYENAKDDLDAANTAVSDLEAAILTPEVQANWMEQEADEVGFELSLRAGFNPYASPDIYRYLLQEDFSMCEILLGEILAGLDVVIERGYDTHPQACWRLYDMVVLEARNHAVDYYPFIEQATKINPLGDQLDRVKEEIANTPTDELPVSA